MTAEVLANYLALDLYRIDLAVLVSKYIGETEENLRRVFEAAEEGGTILLLDERPPRCLFRLLLAAFLGERETLGLFAARCAFPDVVSALAVSHNIALSPFPGRYPNGFGDE